MEEKLKDLSNEERKEQRQSGVTALLDAFWSWVEKTRELPTTNEKLTKALNYAKNHKEGFQTFLEDGRLVISNNLVESHIRPFAVGRKAWLFADTPVSASKKGVWKYYHFHGILSIRYFSTHFFLFCFRRTSSGSWSDHGKYLSNISGAFSWAYPSSGSSVRR